MAKKKTKPTSEATVEILAQIPEKHLASMPQEEQQERVAALVESLLLEASHI